MLAVINKKVIMEMQRKNKYTITATIISVSYLNHFLDVYVQYYSH
jgi:hypothetical protein